MFLSPVYFKKFYHSSCFGNRERFRVFRLPSPFYGTISGHIHHENPAVPPWTNTLMVEAAADSSFKILSGIGEAFPVFPKF